MAKLQSTCTMTTAEAGLQKHKTTTQPDHGGERAHPSLFPRPVPPVRLSPPKLRETPPALSTIKLGQPWRATPAAPPRPTQALQAQHSRSGTIAECTHRPAPRPLATQPAVFRQGCRPLGSAQSAESAGGVKMAGQRMWRWHKAGDGFSLLRDISSGRAE